MGYHGLLQLIRKILVEIRFDRTLKAVHVGCDIIGLRIAQHRRVKRGSEAQVVT
jgi:hypothetical protein